VSRQSLFFIRRNISDGGGGCAAKLFIQALSKNFNLKILFGAGKVDKAFQDAAHKIKCSSRTRSGKAIEFTEAVKSFINSQEILSHSHELVPGSNIIRLGDGVHKVFLRKKGIPLILSLISKFHRDKLKFEKASLEHPNLKALIVNSIMVKKEVLSTYSVDENKIFLIRNIVRREFLDFEYEKIERDPYKIVFVGSGWKRKGLLMALRVISKLPPVWTLDIYGDDKDRKKYLMYSQKNGLHNRVNFFGERHIGPTEYSRASVLIHPALYEPFPNVAIEALSVGVMVVSSTSSGTSDFNRQHGVFTADCSVDEYVANVELAGKVSEKERLKIRNSYLKYDLDYLVKRIEAVYKFAASS